MAFLNPDPNRISALDFTVPLYSDEQTIVYRRPEEQTNLLALFLPFKQEVGITVLETSL